MKRSAIYLGISAAILAVAGAFTTKASTKVAATIAYTIKGGTYGTVTCVTAVQETVCKTINGTLSLYTQHGSPLWTVAD